MCVLRWKWILIIIMLCTLIIIWEREQRGYELLSYEETYCGGDKLFWNNDINNSNKKCVEFKKENKEWINDNYCKFNLTCVRQIKGVNKCVKIFSLKAGLNM